jgi:hypothetical protein
MPDVVTIELKRRRGLPLLWALFKTTPAHYRILRKYHGRLRSLRFAFRLAFCTVIGPLGWIRKKLGWRKVTHTGGGRVVAADWIPPNA